MVERTIEGHFWHPENQKRRFYGRIDFDLDQGVRLHLVNTGLVGFTENPTHVEVLHGLSIDGRRLTVLGVLLANSTSYGLGRHAGDTVDAFASQLLVGGEDHVGTADELLAKTAAVSLHGLKEFVTIGGPGPPLLLPPLDPQETSPRLQVQIDEGVTLTMRTDRRRSGTMMSETKAIEVSSWLTFEDPTALPVIQRDYVDTFRDLIAFSTRRASYATALRTYPEMRPFKEIEILERARPRPGQAGPPRALVLNLGAHDEPGDVVAAWFDLRRRIGPVWGLLFATLGGEQLLLEDQLLGLLAFAEGYHRALHDQPRLTPKQTKAAQKAIKDALEDDEVRKVYVEATAHADGQTQRERLRVLTDRALDPLGDWWDMDRDVFVARLIHTRDWLIHWGTRRKHAVTEAADLYELVRGLLLVLQVNLLLDLGLNETAAAAATTEGGWRFEGPPNPVADRTSS